MLLKSSIASLLALSLAVSAQAQEKKDTGQIAGDVASQPARDVGAVKTKIPPVLIEAKAAPYAPARNCAAIASGIARLTATLGPDYGSGTDARRAGVAEIGGRAVVNSLIPFRGVVREVSGAAAAQRRLEAAISAGYARRGYLRGLQVARGCKR